ncbi:MAG: Lrp/AsnC family transcriptional regulator [bacterium]
MTYKKLSNRILKELREDGRQSLRELAEKFEVSATTIGKRLDKLKEEGKLKGITADIDYEKLGYNYVAVTRFKVQGDQIPRALELLEEHSCLTNIYEITGDYDILAIGHYYGREEMNEIIKKLQGYSAIKATNTSVVLNIFRENYPLPLEKNME